MVTAHCTRLFPPLPHCIRLFWLSRILLSFAVVSSISLPCSCFFHLTAGAFASILLSRRISPSWHLARARLPPLRRRLTSSVMMLVALLVLGSLPLRRSWMLVSSQDLVLPRGRHPETPHVVVDHRLFLHGPLVLHRHRRPRVKKDSLRRACRIPP